MIRALGFLFMVLCFTFAANGQEICDNAVDDDGDGLIDLNDDECICEVNIDLSMIPNPSFEDTLCCPTSEGMMDCAESWIQASGATSDYYHSCGLTGFDLDGALPPELPLPGGGEAFIGLFNFGAGYREYVGACTSGPLLAGVSYTLEFYTAYSFGDVSSVDLEVYGSPTCTDLPWAGIGCPEGVGSWELLGAETVFYEMDGSWQLVSLTFTPLIDMNAISIGATCGEIGVGEGSYFYFDDLVLLDTETAGYIDTTNGWCSNDLILNAVFDTPGGTYQWYKDGIALPGENAASLEPVPYGEGEFTVVYAFPGGCQRVVYDSPSIPNASFDHNNVCFGHPVNFENTTTWSQDDLDTWEWRFGDGDLEYDRDVTHYYSSSGVYPTELVAYSSDASCNDTAFANVSVGAVPVVDFALSGESVSFEGGGWISCAGDSIFFTDLTTIAEPVSTASWSWSLDDSIFSSLQNPAIIFEYEGNYDLELRVVMENGCIDSATQSLEIVTVHAEFNALDSVCEGEPVLFQDASYTSDASSIVEWRWDMGDDSDPISLQNPVFTFEEGRLYFVGLYVENERGCRDSVEKEIVIFPKPNPNFYANRNPTDYFNTDLSLIMIYPNETSSYQWLMPGGDPNFSMNYAETNVTYPVFTTGEYPVILIEETVFGCVDSVTHVIRVLEDEMIYAPNAFTINNDPINPTWGVYTEGFRLDEYQLQLYNRWGELVWVSQDPDDRWDGTYANGETVPAGTYVWHVKARDQINDKVFEYYGHVTVLK